jgi:hypothetical protein
MMNGTIKLKHPFIFGSRRLWWPTTNSLAGSPERDPVSVLQEAGGALEPVWMNTQSCVHRVRIEKRPTPGESLLLLHYPVPAKSGRVSVKCLVFLLRFEQVNSRIKVGLVPLLNLLARRYVMG